MVAAFVKKLKLLQQGKLVQAKDTFDDLEGKFRAEFNRTKQEKEALGKFQKLKDQIEDQENDEEEE